MGLRSSRGIDHRPLPVARATRTRPDDPPRAIDRSPGRAPAAGFGATGRTGRGRAAGHHRRRHRGTGGRGRPTRRAPGRTPRTPIRPPVELAVPFLRWAHIAGTAAPPERSLSRTGSFRGEAPRSTLVPKAGRGGRGYAGWPAVRTGREE